MQRQSYIKISSLYIAHHYHAGQSQQEAVTSPTVHRDRRDDVHADQSAGMEESQLPCIYTCCTNYDIIQIFDTYVIYIIYVVRMTVPTLNYYYRCS